MQVYVVVCSLVMALFVGCSGLSGQEIAFDSHEISSLNFEGRNRTVNNRSDAELLARAIHDEVNRVRVERGLRTLEWGPRLSQIAVNHSQDMGRRGYFEHDSPEGDDFGDRYQRADYTCQVPTGGRRILLGGENLFLTHRAAMIREHEDGRQEQVNLFTIRLDEVNDITRLCASF